MTFSGTLSRFGDGLFIFFRRFSLLLPPLGARALLSHNYHTLLDHCCWIHPFSVFVAKVDSVDAFCICRSQKTVNASVLVSSSIAYCSWGSSSNISCSSLCTSSFVTLVVADTVLSSSRCLFFAPSRSCKVLLSRDAPWFYWSPPATTACFNRLLSFLQDYLLSRCSNYCQDRESCSIFLTNFLDFCGTWRVEFSDHILSLRMPLLEHAVASFLWIHHRACNEEKIPPSFSSHLLNFWSISSLHRRRCRLEAIDSCRWFLNVIASMRSRPAQ